MKRFLIFTLQLFIFVSVKASTERFTAYADASQLVLNDSITITVQDDKFLDENGLFDITWDDDFYITRTTNYVGLMLNPQAEISAIPFELTVNFFIEYITADNEEETKQASLTIVYDPQQNTRYASEQYFRFEGGHLVNAIATDYSISGISVQQLENILFLTNIIEVERYYKMNTNEAPSLNANLNNSSGELILTWNQITGAEKYELEWTFVNSYDGNGGTLPSVRYDFNKNSRRITIASTQHRIPMVFEQGYIVYRVRAIGRNANLDPLFGEWSRPQDTETLQGNVSHGYAFSVTGNNVHGRDKLNWQYVARYSDQGKRRGTVSYFDGLLRKRQEVNQLNTDSEILVSEIFYDHQGRQSIVTLPAPVNESAVTQPVAMRFYPGFSTNLQGEPYGPSDFDTQQGCENSAAPMSDNTGAAHYFSSSNPMQEEFNQFLPQSNGFPFTHTEYTPDLTGRISRVSRPGEDLRLESGNERKFFYGVPAQDELDFIFGNDAGLAEFFKKNITIDENGQVSVAYLNSRNQVVATALAGDAPPNLDALATTANEQITQSILKHDRRDGNKLIAVYNFVVADNQVNYSFNYNLFPEQYNESYCDQYNFCFDCVYDLRIVLRNDECGNIVYEHYQSIGSVSELTDNCTGGQQQILNFQEILDVGSYSLIRELIVNEEAANQYVRLYMSSDPCLEFEWQTILTENIERMDTIGCILDCDNCIIESFYEVEVDGEIVTVQFTDEEIIRLQEACEQVCGISIDFCESMYSTLLFDVSPGGQYALYRDPEDGTFNPGAHVMSVLNDNVLLTLLDGSPLSVALINQIPLEMREMINSRNWRNPVGAYKDMNGDPSYIVINPQSMLPEHLEDKSFYLDNDLVVAPQYLVHVSDFVDNWLPSWAESLVQYHPEYCYYQYCLENQESFDFDNMLMEITEYNAAQDEGILNLLQADPYFQDPTSVYYQQMADKLAGYYTDEDGNSFSIIDIVLAMVYCNNPAYDAQQLINCLSGRTFGEDPMTRDQQWEFYKALYMAAKNEIVNQNRHVFALNCGGYNACIGKENILATDYMFASFMYQQILSGCTECLFEQNCMLFQAHLTNKQKRFLDAQDLYDMLGIQMTGDLLADIATGENYADHSMMDMCDKCPSAMDIEALLTKLALQYELTARNDISSGGYISHSLHDALDGENYQWNVNITDKEFTGIISMTNREDCHIQLYNLQDRVINWDDIRMFSCMEAIVSPMHYDYAEGGNFRIRAITADNHVYWLEGFISCLNIGECNLPPLCLPSDAGKELMDLFNAVFHDRPALMPSPVLPLSNVPVANLGGEAIKTAFPEAENIPQFTWSGSLTNDEGTTLSAILVNGKTQCQFQFQMLTEGYTFTERFRINGMIPATDNFRDCMLNQAILIAEDLEGNTFRLMAGVSCLDFINCCSSPTAAMDCPEILPNGNFAQGIDFQSGLTAAIDSILPGTFKLMTPDQLNSYFAHDESQEDEPGTGDNGSDIDPLDGGFQDGFFGQGGFKPMGQRGSALFGGSPMRNLVLKPGNVNSFNAWEKEINLSEGREYVFSGRIVLRDAATGESDNMPSADGLVLRINQQPVQLTFTENPRTDELNFEAIWFAISPGNKSLELSYQTNTSIENTLVVLSRLSMKELNCKSAYCCPPVIPGTPPYQNPCEDMLYAVAEKNARNRFNHMVLNRKREIKELYIAQCLDAAESFEVSYSLNQYHYTLYYFDQAGNLVKTVPTANVELLTQAQVANVRNYRSGQSQIPVYPNHSMVTEYTYNSFNQLIEKNSPDEGNKKMWYDPLGRIVASQSAEQQKRSSGSRHDYNYVFYDPLNRIVEAGEVSTIAISRDVLTSQRDFQSWVMRGSRNQIVRTIYDTPFNQAVNNYFSQGQQFLRNNVASILYFDEYREGDMDYDNALHFSYDMHGNLKTMIQEMPALAAVNQHIKTLEYEYDIVSGQIHKIIYQRNQPDQFLHRYEYDADERLTKVFTSRDGFIWDNDATYFYYRHGPLARMELGGEKVQGVDYAYTLQGWLKAINSGTLLAGNDMGEDGKPGSIHEHIPEDVFGMVLHYFNGDYQPIGNALQPIADITGSALEENTRDLYNGMITHSVTALAALETDKIQAGAFTYDQAYRLTGADYFRNFSPAANQWLAGTNTQDYRERFSWDGNSNLITVERHGAEAEGPLQMDNLTYHYYSNTNRLEYITDLIPDGNYSIDLDNQSAGNYTWDASGNMTRDRAAGITNIQWNRQGFVDKATKQDGAEIEFQYNGLGQRIAKTHRGITTYYVRDLQGRIMSTYSIDSDSVVWETAPIYGINRLGMYQADLGLNTDENEDDKHYTTFYRGKKRYELSNHLGNVMTVISDRKVPESAGEGSVAFTADIVSAADYYAFGMAMPGRQYQNDYMYGFNAMERDDEIKGDGNSYDFGARLYDPRAGIWLSVDPLAHKFPHASPYLAFAANPVNFIDPDGREPEDYLANYSENRNIIERASDIQQNVSMRWRAFVTRTPKEEILYRDLRSAISTAQQRLDLAIETHRAINQISGDYVPIPNVVLRAQSTFREIDRATRHIDRAAGMLENYREIHSAIEIFNSLPESYEDISDLDDRIAAGRAFDQMFGALGSLGRMLPDMPIPYLSLLSQAAESETFERVAREWGGIYENENTSRGRGMIFAIEQQNQVGHGENQREGRRNR